MTGDKMREWLGSARWIVAGLLVAVLIALAGIIGFSVGDSGSGGSPASPATAIRSDDQKSGQGPDFGVLNSIYDILRRDFVDQAALDPELLKQGAIDGLIKTLGDPHTTYIDQEGLDLGTDIISGTYQGIGAQVGQDPATSEVVIVAPFTNSPAEKAGVRPGDAILGIDGESAEGWTVAQVVRRVRGQPGTTIVLSVRHTNGVTEQVSIVRDVITVQTVYVEPPFTGLEDSQENPVTDLAYIRIEQFTTQTPDDVANLLSQFRSRGLRNLILDLRLNPGGGLDSTVQVADLFLDSGVVLTQVNRDGSERSFRAASGGLGAGFSIVVLIGPGSASGAEVLAAALRDNGRATLIGEPTFGKGTVNNLRQLPDGGGLYVSIARWLTPNGAQIEGVGVLPDINIPLTDADIDAGKDPVLYRGIEALRAQAKSQP